MWCKQLSSTTVCALLYRNGFLRMQLAGQRAAVEVDGDLKRAGSLGLGHSHGGRAEGPSEKAGLV